MNSKKIAAMVLLVGFVCAGPVFAQDASAPAVTSSPQVQQPAEGGVDWPGVGYGALAIVADAVYVPAKLVYATLGGITGGAAYGVTGGNMQTANTIWRSSLGGDYVVTPRMVRGEDPIYFSGPTATAPAPGEAAANQAPLVEQNAPSMPPSQSPPMPTGRVSSMPADRGAGPVNPTRSARPVRHHTRIVRERDTE
jgi:hypothetical protein